MPRSQFPGFSGCGMFLTTLLAFVVPQCCFPAHPAPFPSVWAPTKPMAPKSSSSLAQGCPLHKKTHPRVWIAQDLVPVVELDSNSWFPSPSQPVCPHSHFSPMHRAKLALVRAGEEPEFQGWLQGRGVGKSLQDLWSLQAERFMKAQKTSTGSS